MVEAKKQDIVNLLRLNSRLVKNHFEITNQTQALVKQLYQLNVAIDQFQNDLRALIPQADLKFREAVGDLQVQHLLQRLSDKTQEVSHHLTKVTKHFEHQLHNQQIHLGHLNNLQLTYLKQQHTGTSQEELAKELGIQTKEYMHLTHEYLNITEYALELRLYLKSFSDKHLSDVLQFEKTLRAVELGLAVLASHEVLNKILEDSCQVIDRKRSYIVYTEKHIHIREEMNLVAQQLEEKLQKSLDRETLKQEKIAENQHLDVCPSMKPVPGGTAGDATAQGRES